jgi:Leucine-rich repeat (LRR) protein
MQLYLQFMAITIIPPEIAQLTNLTLLGLDRNEITIIPPEIAQRTGAYY